jgi:hypothetical protein
MPTINTGNSILTFNRGKGSKNPVQETAVKCLEKGNSYQNL